MDNKKLLIAGIITTLLLVGLSGCFEKTSTGTVSAAQIKANALQFVGDIKTYAYSMSGTIKTTITNETGTSTIDGSITGTGAVDLANRKLKVEATMAVPGQMEGGSAFYIVDDVLYVKTETEGNVTWMKTNITNADETWASYDQMEQQAELLEYSDVERLDDEVVNGVDCYVLSITPDLEKYFEIIMGQTGTDGIDIDYSDFFQGWSIKQWFAKDTNFIMKIYNQMTINMSVLMGRYYEEYVPVWIQDYEYYIFYNNYNVAVDVELPEEAENAPWSIDII